MHIVRLVYREESLNEGQLTRNQWFESPHTAIRRNTLDRLAVHVF